MVVLSGIKAYQLGHEALALRRHHFWQSRTSKEREVDVLAGCFLKTPTMALLSHPMCVNKDRNPITDPTAAAEECCLCRCRA